MKNVEFILDHYFHPAEGMSRLCSSGARSDNCRYRAWEMLDELSRTDPVKAWDVILHLVDQASDREQLAYFAATALEHFLVRWGKEFLDRVVSEAEHNRPFASALRFVDQLDDRRVESELERYRGGSGP